MSWWEEEMKSKGGEKIDSEKTGSNYMTAKRKKRKGIISKFLEGITVRLGLTNPSEEDDEEEEGINDYSFPENWGKQRRRYKKYQEFLNEKRQKGGGMSYPSMEEKTFKVVDK